MVNPVNWEKYKEMAGKGFIAISAAYQKCKINNDNKIF